METIPLCDSTGSVWHFQDLKDKSSIANLKYHVLRCFCKNVVNAAIAGKKPTDCNGFIFTLFACKGKQLIKYLHHVHTNPEVWYEKFTLIHILHTHFWP